ncbi:MULTISPECIES: 50S ribosomal protein L4 [Dehalococcoides]|uniref:50S ribosomal protein L4 n=1 Tax=Dehalococcoides TaxID=61434 RepID=UPI0003C89789|nr:MULTISPECIES: 50S ribosomal protein L4 [Dehalococcoides]AHB13184.1 50S ribosomal protein L4 [Dehalococcoides mccartyi GY50]AII57620.1 50S ribosomal protein L4 [Dehalococcoides mccartyi CG1]APH12105.1 50S ribosomal protein L4 [Dehalococcoides mccartyi]QYY58289.1 50S ribosomal protein L4 [Dehalococcoides mccartyi]BAQ34364.1 50S ribosomal protein L4 [Dehalococcoides sp. UCH007]
MEIPVYNASGEIIKNISISEDVFGVPFNEALVHQAFVAQQANARQGTQSTKTRGEVQGSSRKIYRQKGTGNARMGTNRSPVRRHGGVAFGPRPRDFSKDLPKKMRRQAIRCVLSFKLESGELKVIDQLSFEEPKTRDMAKILAALQVISPTLIAVDNPDTNFIKSARNIPAVKTTPANLLNISDMLKNKQLVMTEEAVRQVEELWGQRSG